MKATQWFQAGFISGQLFAWVCIGLPLVLSRRRR